ncbi:hypothetical protein C2S52_007283 [Perilla frutescens var. hirtella]|nr:hypothetical protein C2S52_007283 [Perilla frutescens var. hirtella]
MLREHCQKFKPDLLGILEPKTRFTKRFDSFWRELHLVPLFQNVRDAKNSNIWVFSAPAVKADVLFSSSQCVVLSFEKDDHSGKVAFVHASNSYITRRALWLDLARFQGEVLFLGDFNVIIRAHERSSSKAPNKISYADFQNFIDEKGLLEVPFSGLFFSWSSRRLLPEHVENRLDRALVSVSFWDRWDTVNATLLPRISSNHSPLVINCVVEGLQGPRPFRFLSMWTEHNSFFSVVRDSWVEKEESRSKIRKVMNKLKRLKLVLKHWNLNSFRHVKMDVKALQEELLVVQEKISNEGYSDVLLEREFDIQLRVNEKLSAQSSLLQQKSRIGWLNDGDRSTAYFHRALQFGQA